MAISAKLNAILCENAEAVNAVVNEGADIGDYDELYEDLFSYFCETNEMPYGTAKARDGDPYEWISNKLVEITNG